MKRLALRRRCETVLVGDDDGVDTTAHSLGVRHLSGVDCNEYGTLLLNDAYSAGSGVQPSSRFCATSMGMSYF